MSEKITVKRVSELTGMNPLTIRHGIEQGTLPIGAAIRNGSNRTYYHIAPQKVANYLGITIEEVYGRPNKSGTNIDITN